MESKIVGKENSWTLPKLATLNDHDVVVMLCSKKGSFYDTPIYEYVVVHSSDSNYPLGGTDGSLYESDLESFDGKIVLSS